MSQEKQEQKANVQEIDPLQKRVLAIMSGEEKPPNETIAYIVQRANEARAEGKQHADRAQLLERELAEHRTRLTELRGVIRNYADDVKHWLEDTKIVVPEPKRIVKP